MKNGTFWTSRSIVAVIVVISVCCISWVKGQTSPRPAQIRCEERGGRWDCGYDDDDDELDCDCNDPDDDGLETGAIIGIIIGAIAILICVPIIFCFCCSWYCFKKTEPAQAPEPRTIYIVTPPSNSGDVNGNRTDTKIPLQIMESGREPRQLPLYSDNEPSQRPSGAGASAPRPEDDPEGFYSYGGGFSNQPPPPYPFPLTPEEDPFYNSSHTQIFKSRPSYAPSEQSIQEDDAKVGKRKGSDR